MKTETKKAGGISIRVTHIAMLALAAVMIALLIFSAYKTSSVFDTLNKATGSYIARQDAAHDVMEASDYLTEMAQRFTLDGDPQYMSNYFEEASVSRRRENAVVSMAENNAEQGLIEQVQNALNESNNLMFTEYYAMRLVVDARDIREYPDTLRGVELKPEDEALDAEAKMDLARSMVMGPEYYSHKEIIRNNLRASLSTLDKLMANTRKETTGQLNRELSVTRGLTMAVTVLLLVMLGLNTWLGTSPLIRAEKSLRQGKRVPVTGAREFRHLAGAYNALKKAQTPEAEPPEKPEKEEE